MPRIRTFFDMTGSFPSGSQWFPEEGSARPSGRITANIASWRIKTRREGKAEGGGRKREERTEGVRLPSPRPLGSDPSSLASGPRPPEFRHLLAAGEIIAAAVNGRDRVAAYRKGAGLLRRARRAKREHAAAAVIGRQRGTFYFKGGTTGDILLYLRLTRPTTRMNARF